jgi:hypothetical protein
LYRAGSHWTVFLRIALIYNDFLSFKEVSGSQKTLKRLNGVQGVEGSNPFTPTIRQSKGI